MYRWLMTAVLAACLTGMVAAQDIVTYHDRVTKKKGAEVRGKIEEESPKGIKIKVREGKKEVIKEIPASDIERILYKAEGVLPPEFRAPFAKEDRARLSTGKLRAKGFQEALDLFTKLEDQLKGNINPRRYIQYKIAELTVLMARDDPSKADMAIRLLTEFKTAHPTSWAIVPALKTLAKLQEDAGKTDEARKTYEELAEVPDVPRELKQESEILVGRLLLRGGKFVEAQKRLDKLAASLKPGDLQKPFVDAYLAESKIGQDKLTDVDRELAGVIKASSDSKLRGVVYNLLGDYYRKKGQLEDAFWSYLRVDALYNEDPEAQGKALYYLAKLVGDVRKKDTARSAEYIRRLRDKRFAGTEFQKLLPPAEKTDEEPKKVPVKKKTR